MRRGVRIAGAAGALLAAAILGRWAVRSAFSTPAEIRTLDDILRSKNDNDPRLDRDFNALTPGVKALFRRKYLDLPAERRNERGTIVYLLGKNLSSAEDWAFLRAVVREPPCLSLADCSKNPGPEEKGETPGDDVTLAYPALVALKQAQRAMESLATERPAHEALEVVKAGMDSKTPAVARLAQALHRRFPARDERGRRAR